MADKKQPLPTEEELIQEIEARTPKIDGCKSVQHTVIKCGPQTYKTASVLQFADPDSDEVAHHELRLNSYRRKAEGGFDFDGRPIRWSCRDGEIRRLRTFLETYEGAATPGKHSVVPASHADVFRDFIGKLDDVDLTTPQLLELVAALAARSSDLRKLPNLGEGNTLRMAAAAIRVAHRTAALTRLRELIESDALEHEFQTILDQNWWMLGSHYLERIERRHWTPEETVDIMLRTADNYFDIIELKRSSASVLKKDHGHWIVSSEVNDAVNQAAHYLSEIEKTQTYIFERYRVNPYKLKAKVLIGHLGDEIDLEQKRQALRMYNSHLHRIEVLTYDQLAAIGQNVIDANAGESGETDAGDEGETIPF